MKEILEAASDTSSVNMKEENVVDEVECEEFSAPSEKRLIVMRKPLEARL